MVSKESNFLFVLKRTSYRHLMAVFAMTTFKDYLTIDSMIKLLRISCLFLPTLLALSSCTTKPETGSVVHLTGKLINWGNASKILNARNLESDFGLGKDHIIKTDYEGVFELSFNLSEPSYFSLGRNKLYLSPGDKLYMEVDYRDPEAGVFKGDGADLQSYLSGVAFPKGGSYLEGGRNVKSDSIAKIIQLAQSRTEERELLLSSIKNAPQEFRDLEEMRLKLDFVNTILSFPIYGSFKKYWKYSEDKKAEVLQGAKYELNTTAMGIMQDAYMKHPNFRDMLLTFADDQLKESGIFSTLEMTDFMQEYDALGALLSQLELGGLTEEMKAQAEDFLSEGHSKAYNDMVKLKLAEYEALELGQPAFDVTFKTVEGEDVKLSSFKGKLIYVDLWATWCGPCIDELPAFEQLRHDYADKEVVFIPVSIDTNLDAWKKYLAKHNLTDNELIINRLDLADYKVITIPRYLLIDKDFKIISVFAPMPSLAETRELIDEHL